MRELEEQDRRFENEEIFYFDKNVENIAVLVV